MSDGEVVYHMLSSYSYQLFPFATASLQPECLSSQSRSIWPLFLLFTSQFPSLKDCCKTKHLEGLGKWCYSTHTHAHTHTKTQTAALLRHLFKVIENFICSVTETRHCHPPCKNKCSSITEIICGLCTLLTTLCCSKVINSLLVHTPSSHEKHIIKGVESKPARFLFFSVVVRSHIHLYDVWLVWMDLLCVWPKACVWSVCLVWRAGENVFLHCASE